MSKPQKTARIPENEPLSEEEKKIIATCHTTFGDRLTNISENTVIRFVRGYNNDPNHEAKSIEMLGAMLKWREEAKVNEIANTHYDKEELFRSIWTSGLHGRDKLGHVIYVDKLGQVDGSKLYKLFTIDEVIAFHIKQMEQVQRTKDELSVRAGRRLYKQIVILDFKGLGMSHLSSKFTEPLKKFIKIDQDMYPETLFKMFIVNGGLVLKAAWALASPFLDAITKSNIIFGGENELKNYIDIDQIPKYLGGTCRCEKCLITPFVAGPEAAGRPSITDPAVAAQARAENPTSEPAAAAESAPAAAPAGDAAPAERKSHSHSHPHPPHDHHHHGHGQRPSHSKSKSKEIHEHEHHEPDREKEEHRANQ